MSSGDERPFKWLGRFTVKDFEGNTSLANEIVMT